MRLPQVSRRMTRDEVLVARGTPTRWRSITGTMMQEHMPVTHQMVPWRTYEAMETARCEALGARYAGDRGQY